MGEQVGQRTVGAHRHALAIDVVVFGRGDGAPSEHRLAVAIEGDGVGDASGVHPEHISCSHSTINRRLWRFDIP